jgi:hypothetical protein
MRGMERGGVSTPTILSYKGFDSLSVQGQHHPIAETSTARTEGSTSSRGDGCAAARVVKERNRLCGGGGHAWMEERRAGLGRGGAGQTTEVLCRGGRGVASLFLYVQIILQIL